jgi:hypothetical protein
MKYSLQIDIALPRDRVIELFDNSDNLHCWQPGLVSYEHLSGEPGQVDAKAKLVYKMGNRDIENRFSEIDANLTRWDFNTEFKLFKEFAEKA